MEYKIIEADDDKEFREAIEIYLTNEMCEYINEGYVSTNTGKNGHHR